MTGSFLLSRQMCFRGPPPLSSDCALFLDLDGTLLEIAASPDRVVVPPDLVSDLASGYAALDGALAIVSGRTLYEIDTLLAPLRVPGAGEHGAVIRLANGDHDVAQDRVPLEWIAALEIAAQNEDGILIEGKEHTVVAHYRRAPQKEDFCRRLCAALIDGCESEFELLQGRMAIEIRPRSITKARPVERLMATAPFRGRRPIFVGDDVTDEDGFRAVGKLGGEGLDVLLRFGGSPELVRAWLRTLFED